MPLYVKDRDVGELASRLAAIKGVSKTEAVRQALRREMDATQELSPRVKQVMAFVKELHRKHGPVKGTIDKAWVDSLYEDD